jgi:hypothetical protein
MINKRGNKNMDYFDYKRTKELEQEANKHEITPTLESRIQELERKILIIQEMMELRLED